MRPTGGRSYVLLQHVGGRTKRVSLGPVPVRGIEAVRRECHAREAAPEAPEPEAPERAVPSFRDFVAGERKKAHFERYKPSTQRGARHVLARQLLPAFGSKPLDRIAPAHVRRWFDSFSRTAPGHADNALRILRQILNFTVACGLIDANPTRGIRQNRRPALTRFLSRGEIARLHEVLDEEAGRGERFRHQAEIMRLLLLTGCRRGEIIGLRWSEVQDDRLVLSESKTGPRTVPLGSQTRAILDRQPRGASPYVFPSPLDPARRRDIHLPLWYRVRRKAGIEDVRLHDLRHTMASHAVMNGVPVPVVSRMLGHANVEMTMRYAHLADRDIEAAAERVGAALARAMGL